MPLIIIVFIYIEISYIVLISFRWGFTYRFYYNRFPPRRCCISLFIIYSTFTLTAYFTLTTYFTLTSFAIAIVCFTMTCF